jgi:hypothetical protein
LHLPKDWSRSGTGWQTEPGIDSQRSARLGSIQEFPAGGTSLRFLRSLLRQLPHLFVLFAFVAGVRSEFSRGPDWSRGGALAGHSTAFDNECPTLDRRQDDAMLKGMETLSAHPAPVSAAVRIRPGKRNSLRQVLQLQQATYDTTLALKEDVVRSEDVALRARTASSIAQLARSWDTLENRKRVLRGRPLPGSLRPEKAKPTNSARSQALFTE